MLGRFALLDLVLNGAAEDGGVEGGVVDTLQRHLRARVGVLAPVGEVEAVHLVLRDLALLPDLRHEVFQALLSRPHPAPEAHVVELDDDVAVDAVRGGLLLLSLLNSLLLSLGLRVVVHHVAEQGLAPVGQVLVAELAVQLLVLAAALELPARHAARVNHARALARANELHLVVGAALEADPAHLFVCGWVGGGGARVASTSNSRQLSCREQREKERGDLCARGTVRGCGAAGFDRCSGHSPRSPSLLATRVCVALVAILALNAAPSSLTDVCGRSPSDFLGSVPNMQCGARA